MSTSKLIVEEEYKEQVMHDVATLPIAEIFTSIQGEGAQSGMRMTFIRLAGCTVGKRYPKGHYSNSAFPQYPSYVNECTTFDGRHFPCDTNYQTSEKLTFEEIIARVPEGVQWVSITGGEPLMHKSTVALCAALRAKKLHYHIETSATIIPDSSIVDSEYCYLACSPKANYIEDVIMMADEVRFMVDKDFNVEEAGKIVAATNGYIYLSPLSLQDDIMRVDRASMAMCLKLIELPMFSDARISLQIHKYLAVR